MKKEFSEEVRDQAMNLLTSEQQSFILNRMKRGKRTAWLNVMAALKGEVISSDDDEQAVSKKLGGWILDDYDDLGARVGKCECGQSIRYVYRVIHVEKQTRLELGSECIKQYTGLDAKTVAEIKKGLKKIDNERDEILDKVVKGWRLNFDVPETITIPNDIQQHLALGLPLLERQAARLKILVDNHNREKQICSELSGTRTQTQTTAAPFDLFTAFQDQDFMLANANHASPAKANTPTPAKEVTQTEIPESWVNFIDQALVQRQQKGQQEITARDLADEVALHFGYGDDRYSTSKPRTYFFVARYLDQLSTREGILELVDASKENRWYTLRG